VMAVIYQVWRPFRKQKVTLKPGIDEPHGKALTRQD